MSTTPTSVDGEYGISKTASGITIESLNTTDIPQKEPVPDQKNATADEITYDNRKELRLTYRGTKLTVTAGIVAFDGKNWSVDSHEDAGIYNGLRRYTLVAHRFDNYPSGS